MENTLRRGFFGRERELAELRAAIDDVAIGRGRLLLISGEPGIGKTRLADEFAAIAAERAIRVAWGRCWEGAGAPPYSPWIQILKAVVQGRERERVLSMLGAETAGHDGVDMGILAVQGREPRRLHVASRKQEPGAAQQARSMQIDPHEIRIGLFNAIRDLLGEAAESAPLAIVFDDLHDSDLPSLLLLRFVARELRSLRIAIIGTYREAEVERSPELRKSIGDLLREGVSLPLGGLSEAEAAELVRARAGVAVDREIVTTLHRGTAGNPLFLDGVVQTLSAQGMLARASRVALTGLKLPAGVRNAIRAQLEPLSQRAREMLSAAAVLGNQFESSILREVIGIFAEQFHDLIDEASLAGLISADPDAPGRYRFGHALIRGVLYDSIASNARIALEAEVAAALEKGHAADSSTQLSELAHHFAEAAASAEPITIEKAIDYARRAGEAAENVAAYEDAIAHYETALALIPTAAHERTRAELLARAGSGRLFVDLDTGKGLEESENAIRLFDKLGLKEEAARVHADIALQLSKDDAENLTDMPRAMRHFEKAEQALAQAADGEPLIWLYMGLSVASWKSLDVRRGLDVSMRGVEASRRLGPNSENSNFHILRSHLLAYAGRLREALELPRSVPDQTSHPMLRARLAKNAGELRWRFWEPREAVTHLMRGAADPNLLNMPLIRRAILEHLGIARALAGEPDLARETFDEVPGNFASGLLALAAGNWAQAQGLFEAALANARARGAREREADSVFWCARAMRMRDDGASATQLLEEGLRSFADGSLPLVEMWIRPELALLQADAERTDKAADNLARCRDIIAGGEDWRGLAGHVARGAAVFSAASGDLSDAEAEFARATRSFEEHGVPWEQADTHVLWGRRLLEAGRTADGAAHLERAAEIYRRCNAGQPWIDRALAELPPSSRARAQGTATTSRDAIFRKEGEYWTLAFSGDLFRMKDSKGLQYLANLLRHPGRELPATEVAAIAASGERASGRSLADEGSAHIAADLGDAGEMIDSAARSQYLRRLAELREEFTEAERNHDRGRIQSITAEIRAIEEQLASALGLGGRNRRARAHSERARWTVTNSIKRAIERIYKADPALGRHLRICVRTGTLCAYSPDPDHPVTWQL